MDDKAEKRINNAGGPDDDIDCSEARMSRLIHDSSPLAVLVFDRDSQLVDCNKAALELYGAPSKEEMLLSHSNYWPPIQPNGAFSGEAARELVSAARDKGVVTTNWVFRHKSGELIPGEITLKRIDYNDTFVVAVFVRDLRAEIEAQATVKEVTERNRIMIDVTPIGFVFFDEGFSVVDCNPAALSLFGTPTTEVFAEVFYTLSPECQPDGSLSTDGFKDFMQKAFNYGQMTFEWEHLTATGEPLPTEVTLIRVEYKKSYRLAGYFRDLREHRAVLLEMQRAEQKQREAKELAEDSARTKSEFLANMSHEIRTPMNGIIGITNIAMKKETSDSQKEYLVKIDQSAKSLLRIIDDILDFSKIEAGRLEIEKAEFNVSTVLNDIRNITSFSVSQKSIEFYIEMSDKINFSVIGDSLRLRQVLLNLTSNAIKFTQRGSVTISVDVASINGNNAELLFKVSDTGIGMTEEQASRVFDAFRQADTSTTRKYGGTGLGLAISQTLVGLMGGCIWVETIPDVGSTFYFTAILETTELDENLDSDSTDDGEYTVPEELLGARLLLAEDNEINRMIANEVLESVGFVVDNAVNGLEAVERITKTRYDMILMDLQMPEMDGFTATQIIRANSDYEKTPIIAMTANAMQGDREKSLQAGLDDHITKPLMPKLMLKTICSWLSKARQTEQGEAD